jgi:hypothetical protein
MPSISGAKTSAGLPRNSRAQAPELRLPPSSLPLENELRRDDEMIPLWERLKPLRDKIAAYPDSCLAADKAFFDDLGSEHLERGKQTTSDRGNGDKARLVPKHDLDGASARGT